MMATARARLVANAAAHRFGVTPGPDVAAAGQDHAEAPDQRDPVTDYD